MNLIQKIFLEDIEDNQVQNTDGKLIPMVKFDNKSLEIDRSSMDFGEPVYNINNTKSIDIEDFKFNKYELASRSNKRRININK